MSLVLSAKIILETTSPVFQYERGRCENANWNSPEEFEVDPDKLSEASIAELTAIAERLEEKKLVRALEAIVQARGGDFSKSIPNFQAFGVVLLEYLKANLLDGWLYHKHSDGYYYPELFQSIKFNLTDRNNRDAEPYFVIKTVSHGLSGDNLSTQTHAYSFSPSDITRKRIPDILARYGLYVETTELRLQYQTIMQRYVEEIRPQFAEQFRLNGIVYSEKASYGTKAGRVEYTGRKVVHDVQSFSAVKGSGNSALFDKKGEAGAIPEHPLIKVFDLDAHDFYWVNSETLTPYVYDKSLRDKLVLPESHRDLLDVLTTDFDTFTSDIIEGKSAGNIILAKGPPGVGKTLTAEVYSELTERPLYKVHSGTLGTDPSAIASSLKTIFERVKRWEAILLLDEADVFVMRRGNDIVINAIVAEFLRVLEYFDGLMFMTTNRPDDIDDAIISRCLAIIDYHAPSPGLAGRLWHVMAQNFGVTLEDKLVNDLLKLFPNIVGRDIKMLLKLTLRISRSKGEALSIDTFRRCAMFRAVEMADEVK